MALPAPNLDDRRFQQLVDEAKRYVQQSSPEWTDHNVSDPGVTLIETFAHMVDQLVYRLNRVPDKNYLAFLDLLGVRLFPPTAARAAVTFWLSAPQPETVLLAAGTEVATAGGDTADEVVFATTDELAIVPCALDRLVTRSADGDHVDRTRDLESGKDVPCFQAAPAVGDATLFGLSAAVPRCAVVVRLDSQVEGIGVDPRQPPLVWEAWDGQGWVACEVDEDSTGGLNRPGDVVLHVPAGHTASVVAGHRAGWLRCRVTEPLPGQPFYAESPTVREAEAFTIGGTTIAEHAGTEVDVPLGESAGVPGQRFALPDAPVLLDGEPVVVQVAEGDGWQDWTAVPDFGTSGPDDRHVVLDAALGEVLFPPAVREADGTLRRYGAVPPKGAVLRVPRYRTGGGRSGNVARGAISVLRSSEPYVAEVENREAATGGVDAETVEEAKLRVPHQMRVQERAVTAADYELIARQAVPSLARVRCLPAHDAGGARVLLVPDAVADEGDRLRFEQLVPSDEVLASVARQLDERRLLGTRLVVEPPRYQGVTVVARLVAARADANLVREYALRALHRYLNPLRGGQDGTGWEFGRPVQFGEVFAVLQRVAGVSLVQEVRLFPANPITGARGAPVERLEIAPNALVFSYQHQVAVGAP
ncbi:putative baseplate assembly protein [Saccharothrix coeruleofusca]|uniref:Baseplate assembly protein n=1 Tax=Saccharothrix coeruleofusca TaxID=33919 RepID=A0A918AS75_9PSEU|nr:putative baseplate assembly protein [Saccharothrix coeruleofusca]GGP76305.1 putative baseplate assembly protein [Saccharothrix coeruleofusca]